MAPFFVLKKIVHSNFHSKYRVRNKAFRKLQTAFEKLRIEITNLLENC